MDAAGECFCHGNGSERVTRSFVSELPEPFIQWTKLEMRPTTCKFGSFPLLYLLSLWSVWSLPSSPWTLCGGPARPHRDLFPLMTRLCAAGPRTELCLTGPECSCPGLPTPVPQTGCLDSKQSFIRAVLETGRLKASC